MQWNQQNELWHNDKCNEMVWAKVEKEKPKAS